MSNTRREFLQSSAALAMGVMGGVGAATLAAEQVAVPGAGNTPTGAQAQPAGSSTRAEVQIPTMKFGNAEISRLVLGVNPLYGFAHYNNNFSASMREWYTQDRVCEVLHRANRFGINAFNWVNVERSPEDLARFQSEGGKMHLIIQVMARVTCKCQLLSRHYGRLPIQAPVRMACTISAFARISSFVLGKMPT